MKVTISLVTFNSQKYIPYLLSSIKNQTFKDWELLIIDNNSGDETVARIKSEAKDQKMDYKLMEQRQNLGFSQAHNKIINWSDSEYVLVTNPDIIMEPDFIEKLVNYLDSHPRVGSIGGKLLYWNFEQFDKTNIIDTCGLKIDKRYHISDRLQGEGDENPTSQPVFGLSGALVMYRRGALQATQIPKKINPNYFEYFDEDFFAYKEDGDLAWRLRINSWDNYFLAEAVAYHDRRLSSRKNNFKDRQARQGLNRLSYRNHLCLIKKNNFPSLMFKFWPKFLSYEIAKFFYLLLLDRSSVSGLNEYLKLRRKMIYKRKIIKKMRTIKAKELELWFGKT